MICLATLDVADTSAMSSTVRVYEVGRRRKGQGDSDDENDDGDEEDDGADEDEEVCVVWSAWRQEGMCYVGTQSGSIANGTGGYQPSSCCPCMSCIPDLWRVIETPLHQGSILSHTSAE